MEQRDIGGRTPPHNSDAERALLGALLLDPERLADVVGLLQPEDFYERRHQQLFEVLQQLDERGDPIELVVLSEALRARGSYQQVGGADYLLQLSAAVSSSALLDHHARLVVQAATLRRVIREATDIVAQAYDTHLDGNSVEDLVQDAERRVLEIGARGDERSAEPIDTAIREAFVRLDARSGGGGLTGVDTGFNDLNDMLCGLNKGELIVIAARPSMGKTAFALNLIENAAADRNVSPDGKPRILLFSLEMGRQSLVSRMLCSRAGVPAHLLRSGYLTGQQRRDLATAADELCDTKIFIDDTPGLTMSAVRSRARRLKSREKDLHLVVVDYLQLLSFPRSESRQQEISNISRSLKELSRELEVPVIALAQLSRAVESRNPRRPQLSDLRESGSIEQDADVVMMLYRPSYYPDERTPENEGIAEVIIAKQRNGPTGEVKLQFTQELMRFRNLSPTEMVPL